MCQQVEIALMAENASLVNTARAFDHVTEYGLLNELMFWFKRRDRLLPQM